MKDVWKKFDESGLTHSSMHHLMAVYELLKNSGYARGIDVANYLDISRSSVSVTLHKLLGKGYITEDENKFYQLSNEGKELVNDVLSIRRIAKTFFVDILDLPDEIAEQDACKIEHLLSHETGERLFKFLSFYLSKDMNSIKFRHGFKKYVHKCSDNCEICDDDCFIK